MSPQPPPHFSSSQQQPPHPSAPSPALSHELPTETPRLRLRLSSTPAMGSSNAILAAPDRDADENSADNAASPAARPKVRVQPSDIPAWANAFSGAIGGAVGTLLVFPLDLVTTRLQVQEKLLLEQQHAANEEPSPEQQQQQQLYKGVWDAAVRIYREEGVTAFYNGALQDTLSTMISAFFYFYAYEMLRSARVRQRARASTRGRAPASLGVVEELAIGSLAGIFCKFFTAPLNNIVTRKQTAALVAGPSEGSKAAESSASTSAAQVARDIYAERGVLGFWAGFQATILLSVNPSLTYYFFQMLKVVFIRGRGLTPQERQRRRDNPTKWQLFIFSASAKTVASLLTYPLILVKTQMQVKIKAAKTNGAVDARHTMVGTLADIVKTRGVGHLYQGARGQILKGFFSQGITMLTKDQIARFIIYCYFVAAKLSREVL